MSSNRCGFTYQAIAVVTFMLPSIHAIKKINLNTADVNILLHSFANIGKQRAMSAGMNLQHTPAAQGA